MAAMRALLALALLGCSAGVGVEGDASTCNDGRDNDGDGATDCADPGCAFWCGSTRGDGGPPGSRDAGSRDAGPAPPCSDPIDIVFVIDVSTSMADEVDAIRRGIDSIATRVGTLSSNVQLGLVVFVDDAVAVNGCAPFATVGVMQTELAQWQSFTSTNRQPGGSGVNNGDCPENSLDALYTAATACPWRTGALHILIHVTDDTFAERPARLSGVAVQRTYAETVSALVAREIRVGAFAAPGAGEYCGAGSSPDVGRGFHAPYMGMASLPEATGGSAWSIREVRSGHIDMADAVTTFTMNEYCTLY